MGYIRNHLSQRPGMVGFKPEEQDDNSKSPRVSDSAWLNSNPDFLGADLPIKTHAELRFQR